MPVVRYVLLILCEDLIMFNLLAGEYFKLIVWVFPVIANLPKNFLGVVALLVLVGTTPIIIDDIE